MAVEKRLVLGIQASGMKQGAQEAAQALQQVKRETTATTEQVEKLDKAMDAFGGRMSRAAQQFQDAGTRGQQLLPFGGKQHAFDFGGSIEQTAQKTRELVVETEKYGKALISVDGVAGRVQQRLTAVGKAAIGMFAVDIFAKVAGFSSALDLVQKAADGLAGAFREFFGYGEEWERQQRAVERFTELVKEARLEMEGTTLRRSDDFSRSFGFSVGTDLTKYLDDPNKLKQAAVAYDDLLKKLNELEDKRRSVLNAGGQFHTPDQEALKRIKEAADAAVQSFNDLSNAGNLTAAERWERRMAEVHAERMAHLDEEAKAIAEQDKAEERGFERRLERWKREEAERDRLDRKAEGVQKLSEQRAEENRRWHENRRNLRPADHFLVYGEELDELLRDPRQASPFDIYRGLGVDPRQRDRILMERHNRLYDGRSTPEQELAAKEKKRIDDIAKSTAESMTMSFKDALLNNEWDDLGKTFALQIESALFDAMVATPLTDKIFKPLIQSLLSGSWWSSLGGSGGGSNFIGPPAPTTGALGMTLYGPHIAYPVGGGPRKILAEQGSEDVIRSTQRGRRGRSGPPQVNITVVTKDADSFRRSAKQVADDVRRYLG
jgi:hypothetical protein